nr:TolC family protein [Gammaproteobacteria bacterium]
TRPSVTDGFVIGTTSNEKDRYVASLQVSWNILDFGIGYLNAKEKANAYLISLQQYRGLTQHVIRDVRYAYWKAVCAQLLDQQLPKLMREVHQAIRHSTISLNEKLVPRLQVLKYQESLYEILRHLTNLQQQLLQAKPELAALINLPPGTKFRLQAPKYQSNPLPKKFRINLNHLQNLALLNRPELQMEDYRKRITLDELSKARLEMIPGIGAFAGGNYDSNSALLNSLYGNATVQGVWDLMKIISAPARIAAAKMKSTVADWRRLALNMMVMTQVNVSYLQYYQLQQSIKIKGQLHKISDKIYQQTQRLQHADKLNQLQLVRAHAEAILSNLRYQLAYAEWQNSVGQLLTSVGFDQYGHFDLQLPIKEIAKQLRLALNNSARPLLDPFTLIPSPKRTHYMGRKFESTREVVLMTIPTPKNTRKI